MNSKLIALCIVSLLFLSGCSLDEMDSFGQSSCESYVESVIPDQFTMKVYNNKPTQIRITLSNGKTELFTPPKMSRGHQVGENINSYYLRNGNQYGGLTFREPRVSDDGIVLPTRVYTITRVEVRSAPGAINIDDKTRLIPYDILSYNISKCED